jgi:hypothetical protein
MTVELAGAVRRSDISTDDPLQVDLHGAFTQAILERGGGLDDEPLVQVADAFKTPKRTKGGQSDNVRKRSAGLQTGLLTRSGGRRPRRSEPLARTQAYESGGGQVRSPRRLPGRPSHGPDDSVREDSLVAGVLPN